MTNNKIFIIAGEVSGDVLGAKIMAQMPNVSFSGIGGENMQACGLDMLFPLSDLAVMGFVEVLANARTLTRRINQTIDAIVELKPKIVLTIDSPSFAKRVIRGVKKRGGKLPKFYHVVAPQVWAWGAKRAKKFPEIFDKLYSFFEFEVPYFTKYGLDTVAVGHPISEGLIGYKNKSNSKSNNKKIMALMPGSRLSEVKKLLPLFKSVVEKTGDNKYEFVIPTVETTKQYISDYTKNWTIRPTLISAKDRYDLYSNTFVAIAASGTVTAELAMMHIPTVVVYKMNKITTFLAKRVIKTKWVSLVNILLQKTVYPELLGELATDKNILNEINKFEDAGHRQKIIAELTVADKMWCHDNKTPPSKKIAIDILKNLK